MPSYLRLLAISMLSALVLACGPGSRGGEVDCVGIDQLAPAQYFASDRLDRLVLLSATPAFGNASRLLVINQQNCDTLLQIQLPETEGEPPGYRLADLSYNSVNHLVGILAYREVYALQLEDLLMIGPLQPQFAHEHEAPEENTSARVIHLEVWEEFLVGHSAGKGFFVFDLRKPTEPKVVLPFREKRLPGGDYRSMFLLPSGEEKYQALLPAYDADARTLEVQPLFSQPVRLDPAAQPEIERDPAIQRLIHSGGKILEVNMESGSAIQ